MSDESRIQQLLEETLESGSAPEEVCAEFPELLWRVVEGVRQCQAVEALIDAMFPPSTEVRVPCRIRHVHVKTSNDEMRRLPRREGYARLADEDEN